MILPEADALALEPQSAYRLDPDRVFGALATGAVTGAGITTLPALMAPAIAPVVFLVSLVAWALGVFVLGGAGWWLLRRLRLDNTGAAALAGAFSPAATVLAVAAMDDGLVGSGVITAAAILGVIGGIIGLVVWNMAYRPAPSAPEVSEVFE